MPEPQARYALRDRELRLRILMPVGRWVGCGTLRVLRIKYDDGAGLELTAGYESYQPVAFGS